MSIKDLFADGPSTAPMEYLVTSGSAVHEGVAQAPVVNYGAEAVLRSLFADKAQPVQGEGFTMRPLTTSEVLERTSIKWPCGVCHKLFVNLPKYMRPICVKWLGRNCETTGGRKIACANGCVRACNACAKAAEKGQLKTKAKRDEYLAQRGIVEGGEQLALAMGKAPETQGPGEPHTLVSAEPPEGHVWERVTINEGAGAIVAVPITLPTVAIPAGTTKGQKGEAKRRAIVNQAMALAARGDEAGARALIHTIPRGDRAFSTDEERATDMLREVIHTMPATWILAAVEEGLKKQPKHLRDAKLRRAK